MPGPVDLERLKDFSDGTPEGVRGLVELFLADSRETMAALGHAVERASIADIELLAHRAGGSAAACGARPLAELLFTIERLASAGRVDVAPQLMRSVSREIGEVRLFLEGYLHGMGAQE